MPGKLGERRKRGTFRVGHWPKIVSLDNRQEPGILNVSQDSPGYLPTLDLAAASLNIGI